MNRDALVVGINQYPFLKDNPTSKAKHLNTPASDAEAIALRLEEYGGFRVRRLPESIQEEQRRVDPKKLVQGDVLYEAIIQLFNPVGDSVPQTALLYFGGHGLRRNLGGVTEGFLATSDSNPRKNQWGVSLRWLRELLQKSPVPQQIVWLDCCYSGELLNFAEADLGTAGRGRTRFFNVRESIPQFLLPWQPPDQEPVVNLSEVLRQVYQEAALDLAIDYSVQPVPPLSESDFQWVQSLMEL